MELRSKIGYGVGHILNDVVASMWFTYLVIYYKQVAQLGHARASDLLMIGQFVDGCSTVFVGVFCDKTTTGICGYGKRKSWHLLGTICVAATFPFLYNQCLSNETAPGLKMLWYSLFIALFQFGWACTQIAHISLISDITSSKRERVALTSLRYFGTVSANLFALALTGAVLLSHSQVSPAKSHLDHFHDNETEPRDNNEQCTGNEMPIVGPKTQHDFTIVVFVLLGVGMICSVIFHLLVRENNTPAFESFVSSRQVVSDIGAGATSRRPQSQGNLPEHVEPTPEVGADSGAVTPRSVISIRPKSSLRGMALYKKWLLCPRFLGVCLVYMFCRICLNCSQTYQVLYASDTAMLKTEYMAILPFLLFSGGLLASPLVPLITERFGRKFAFMLGVGFVVLSSVWVLFIPSPDQPDHSIPAHVGNTSNSSSAGPRINQEPTFSVTTAQLMAQSFVFGFGTSILLVEALSLGHDLLGSSAANSTGSASLVFGVMSLFDKVGNGVTIALLGVVLPSCCVYCTSFKYVLAVMPLAACLLACCILLPLSLKPVLSDDDPAVIEAVQGEILDDDDNNILNDDAGPLVEDNDNEIVAVEPLPVTNGSFNDVEPL